jgi:2-C-methyl-D-erythritol 4-phosphate cytidylyltransferase
VASADSPLIAAIICAAGASTRMGGVKKEYRCLSAAFDDEGKALTVLGAALSAFAGIERIALAVIAVPIGAENGEYAARASLPARFTRPAPGARPQVLFVPGGSNRRASVHHALSLLAAYEPDYALIHDGARPWLDRPLIERVIDAVLVHKAVVPVLPLVETPKEINNGFVVRHLRRAAIGAAQTPQGFSFPELLAAYEKSAERELQEHVSYTDDAEVWGEFCGTVAIVPGSPANKKITFPEDL